MLKKILIGLIVIVGAILTYAALQPSHYSIVREVTINSPAAAIFPWINNSQKTQSWVPWAEMDPALKMTYSGPAEGVGSSAHWTSEGHMGVGSAIIVETTPNKSVKTTVQYEKPFAGTQDVEISIVETNGISVVQWSANGQNNFIGRVMCLFVNMDKKVGESFEKGLSKLKTTVEKK